MGNKDYKFDAHKGFESFWAQAMMYSMILKDRYEPDTYICSPLRAETVKRLEMNVSAVRAYMSYAIMEMGLSATAPHAFLPMVLNDDVPEEREIALKFGLILLKRCKRLFVCGGHISPGMLGEITHAFNLGKEIRVFNRGVYGAIKEIAEKNGYDLDLLVYDNAHRYLLLSAQEIIPHEDGKKKIETAKNTLIAVYNSGTNKSRSLVLDTDQVYKAYISEFVNAFIPVWIQYRDTLFKI